MKTRWLSILIKTLLFVSTLPACGWAYDAMVNWGNSKAYFLEGNIYSRYNIEKDQFDSNYPRKMTQFFWPGLWEELAEGQGIDAAVNWGNGKVYLFRGDEYIQYDKATDQSDPGYPKKIMPATWPGLWEELAEGQGIDAAVNWGNGKVYLFRGDEYIRYDLKGQKADPGYPKSISAQTWPGLWQGGIASAINWGNGKVDFINNAGEVIRYDVASGQMIAGYPQLFNLQDWPVLNAFAEEIPPLVLPYHEDKPSGFVFFLVLVALLPLAPLYFLPTLLARKDEKFKRIFLLNFLGGWSFILWVVALVWVIRYPRPHEKFLADKIKQLHELLFEKHPSQTVDYIHQKTRWFKRDIVQILAHMLAQQMLKEELDLETGVWYYYVPTDLEEHTAHLCIAERLKRNA